MARAERLANLSDRHARIKIRWPNQPEERYLLNNSFSTKKIALQQNDFKQSIQHLQ